MTAGRALPAAPSAEALLGVLRRVARAGMEQAEIARLFAEPATAWERVNWGGSGSWRAIVSLPGGTKAAFEFDVDDRLLGYGVLPAPGKGGGEDFAIFWLEP